MNKKKILHINVKKEWFEKITDKSKQEDFREIKDYWTIRIKDKKYDYIEIKNGYQKTAPKILAIYLGYRITDKDEITDLGKGSFYALKIGEFKSIDK